MTPPLHRDLHETLTMTRLTFSLTFRNVWCEKQKCLIILTSVFFPNYLYTSPPVMFLSARALFSPPPHATLFSVIFLSLQHKRSYVQCLGYILLTVSLLYHSLTHFTCPSITISHVNERLFRLHHILLPSCVYEPFLLLPFYTYNSSSSIFAYHVSTPFAKLSIMFFFNAQSLLFRFQ